MNQSSSGSVVCSLSTVQLLELIAAIAGGGVTKSGIPGNETSPPPTGSAGELPKHGEQPKLGKLLRALWLALTQPGEGGSLDLSAPGPEVPNVDTILRKIAGDSASPLANSSVVVGIVLALLLERETLRKERATAQRELDSLRRKDQEREAQLRQLSESNEQLRAAASLARESAESSVATELGRLQDELAELKRLQKGLEGRLGAASIEALCTKGAGVVHRHWDPKEQPLSGWKLAEVDSLSPGRILELLDALLREVKDKLAKLKVEVKSLQAEKTQWESERARLDRDRRSQVAELNNTIGKLNDRLRAVETTARQGQAAIDGAATTVRRAGEERDAAVRQATEAVRLQRAAELARREAEGKERQAIEAMLRANKLLQDQTELKRRAGELERKLEALQAEDAKLRQEVANLLNELSQVRAQFAATDENLKRLASANEELAAKLEASRDILPWEDLIRNAFDPNIGTALAIRELIPTERESAKYRLLGRVLVTMENGPQLISAWLDRIYDILMKPKGTKLLPGEEALKALFSPLVTFVLDALATFDGPPRFVFRLSTKGLGCLVNSFTPEMSHTLLGHAVVDPDAWSRMLGYPKWIQRTLPGIPAPVHAAVISLTPSHATRASFIWGHPDIVAAAGLPAIVERTDARAPVIAGEDETMLAAQAAMQVVYYLNPGIWRASAIAALGDQQKATQLQREFGYDPRLALLFIDPTREALQATGRDVTHLDPFIAIADLSDPWPSDAQPNPIHALLTRLGVGLGGRQKTLDVLRNVDAGLHGFKVPLLKFLE